MPNENRIRVHSWSLAMPRRGIEPRFRARAASFGPLVIVPAGELEALVERANIVSRQLALPFDLCGGGQH